MSNNRYSLRIASAILVGACSLFCSCAKTEQRKAEASSPTQPSPEAKPQQKATPDPPKPNQIQEAIGRVFKGAALIDTTRNPNFIAGDFNGDSSQDIAVILKPAPGKLAQMNEEIPAWILKDPFVTNQPATPLRVAENELLLAVIHGYGPRGWRDPQATQTFLLKNAVGSGATSQAKNDFLTANPGKKLPQLRGDLIGEVLRGRSGYLYYADATYSWYDPKTFQGEPEKRLVHAAAATVKQ